MKQDMISVIIPCYNVEKYVDRCLDSIIKQTIGLENLQIILVNDASIDNTLERLYQWEKKYSENIILINCEENHKQGAARNIGMQYAQGEYISFVDSDDVLDKTMFSRMYEISKKYSCDVVECAYKPFVDGDTLKSEKVFEDYYIKFDDIQKRKTFIMNSLKVAPWGRLYRGEFLRKNKLSFLEDVFFEDCHYSGLAMLLLDSYYAIGETLYYYYQNPAGTIISTSSMEKVKWEIDAQVELIKEITARKILPRSLEPYKEELEFYATVKGCLDPMLMMAKANQLKNEWIEYLIQNLLELFPTCAENQYLNSIQPIFWKEIKEIITIVKKHNRLVGGRSSIKELVLFGMRELDGRSQWAKLYINKMLYQNYHVADEIYELSDQPQDTEIGQLLKEISKISENVDGIVLTVRHNLYDIFVKFLQNIGWKKEVYILPEYLVGLPQEELKNHEFLVQIDINKPCLRYFEFHLCDHCNLKCKGCDHLSNVCEETFADKQKYICDLEQIKKLYWGVQAIKLLGGEPLLNKEIADYMYETRSRFPETFMYIATNGLLIPQMQENFFEAARKTHTFIMLSSYKPTLKMKNQIEEILCRENIAFFYTPEVTQFQKKRYSFSKCIDRKIAHKRCRADMPEPCVTLRDGKLYQCGLPYAEIMNKKFGTQFKLEEGDWVDLYEETSGWKANKKLYEPIPFCEYCSMQPETFEWEITGSRKAVLQDHINTDVVQGSL